MIGAVLFVGLPAALASELLAQSRREGARVQIIDRLPHLSSSIESFSPSLIVSNLDVDFCDGLDLVARLHALWPAIDIAAITSASCLMRAAAAVRAGAATVLARPTNLQQIRSALQPQPNLETAQHMSLDRVIWEYLNQVLNEAGSISEAARRLKLERTSFKRMLRKIPK